MRCSRTTNLRRSELTLLARVIHSCKMLVWCCTVHLLCLMECCSAWNISFSFAQTFGPKASLQQPSTCVQSAAAWQVGKWLSFLGSALALSVMTVISVGIGYAFRSVPDALKSSLPIGQYLGVSLMVYFGVKTLRARHHALSTA